MVVGPRLPGHRCRRLRAQRRVAEIIPGIAATVALWMAAGVGFGRYLAEFSVTYVSYYAGLASAMIALKTT